jgi:hypothetical protein
MKKRFLQKITSKEFRQAAKIFLVFLVIAFLFVYLFFKLVFFIRDNMPAIKKPFIKDSSADAIDSSANYSEQKKVVPVGNITIT